MENIYTRNEVERHNKEEDLWLVIHGGVYDITDFVKKHPGGEEVLINLAGQNGTVCFDDIGHSREAILLKETFKIGEIVNDDNATNTILTSDPIQVRTKPTIADDDNWEYQEVIKEENNKAISIAVAVGVLIYAILFYYYIC